MFDTHTHLDLFGDEAPALWQQAQARGVEQALLVAISPKTWATSAACSKQLGVLLGLGIHPQILGELSTDERHEALEVLPDLLVAHGAVAVGECGLDLPSGDMEGQTNVLRHQLDVAEALGLPISLHVYRAHGAMVALLAGRKPLSAGGVVHGYSGPAELVRNYLRANLSIGFAGAITRGNARKPLIAARAVPLDRLVLETDAPFQPTGLDARDRKRGEPGDLIDVATRLAEARGEDRDVLIAATTQNARRLFDSKT